MPQPIKKRIQDARPEMIKEPPFYTLLVDGGSLLHIAMADEKINSDGVHYGGIYQFLSQMRMMMSKKEFDYVYVFFDDHFSGYKRYEVYKPYKQNRDKHYEDYGVSDYMKQVNERTRNMMAYFKSKRGADKICNNKRDKGWKDFIDDNFDRERDTLMRYFEEMNIRCYMDEVVEGDDFIAYYCKHKKDNERIYIMTGDMDILQVLRENIAVYNLKNKKFITESNFKEYFGYHPRNIVIKKIFCGDASDNIGNIRGLSEEGFEKLVPEYKTTPITVDFVKHRASELINERIRDKKKPMALHENIIGGISNKQYEGDFYEINRRIIDLSEPMMTEEAKEAIDGMMYAPMDPDGRSFTNLYNMILEDKIEDVMGDTRFSGFFSVFKKLDERERRRYDEYMGKK